MAYAPGTADDWRVKHLQEQFEQLREQHRDLQKEIWKLHGKHGTVVAWIILGFGVIGNILVLLVLKELDPVSKVASG